MQKQHNYQGGTAAWWERFLRRAIRLPAAAGRRACTRLVYTYACVVSKDDLVSFLFILFSIHLVVFLYQTGYPNLAMSPDIDPDIRS